VLLYAYRGNTVSFPLTQRHFDEFDALQKARKNVDFKNAALAELAQHAVPRVRELARRTLRFAMTAMFAKYLDEPPEEREWPEGAEYKLWRAVDKGPSQITVEEVEDVTALSIEAAGWWTCGSDGNLHFITTEEWVPAYDEWVAASTRAL